LKELRADKLGVMINIFMVLVCCLFIVGCGTELRNTESEIYIKPFKDFQYPLKTLSVEKLLSSNSFSRDFTDIRFQEINLINGFQVFLLARQDLPSISISAIIKGGKHHSDTVDELLSPLALKLLKQGTAKYPRSEFQRQTAFLGEVMKYRQTSGYSVISIDILPQDLDLALDLLSQQMVHIDPHENAIGKIIEQQILEKKLAQSSGFYLAKLLFYQMNYPQDHFYYYRDADSDLIKALNNDSGKKQLIDFYRRHYLPEQSKLIITGDIDVKKIQQQVEQYFLIWPANEKNKISKLNREFYKESKFKRKISRIDVIDRKGSQQADILYGVVTITDTETGNRVSSDWVALKTIAALLGGGPSSRLFADLREQQGLTYSISARQTSGRYRSPFFIQTSAAHEKMVQTISGIKKHLEYLCRNKVDEKELNQLKQQLVGEIAFQFQTNRQWINDKIHQLEIGLSDDYISDMILKIESMTPEQLLTVSKQYLCAENSFIVVGEEDKLEKNLRRQFNQYQYQSHNLP